MDRLRRVLRPRRLRPGVAPGDGTGGAERPVQSAGMASEAAAAEAVRVGAVVSPRCSATRYIYPSIGAVCGQPAGHYGPHVDRHVGFAYWCGHCGVILDSADVAASECFACGCSWSPDD
jgi:hypothetical protein